MKKTFVMDTRNIGGLQATADHLYKHQQALLKIKSSLNTKQINRDVQKKNIRNNINEDEYQNVLKTFKAVVCMKKIVNTNPPFQKKRVNSITKQERNQLYEHEMNLRAQQRRIESASSMQERKKNPFDPIAHPPIFFRREQQDLQNIRLDNFVSHIARESNSSDRYNNSQKKSQSRQKSSTKQSLQKVQIQKDDEINFVFEIPKIKGYEKEDYIQLKNDILKTIFTHRMYKTEDIESLFGRVLIHNPNLNHVWIEDVFNEIRDEFTQEDQ